MLNLVHIRCGEIPERHLQMETSNQFFFMTKLRPSVDIHGVFFCVPGL